MCVCVCVCVCVASDMKRWTLMWIFLVWKSNQDPYRRGAIWSDGHLHIQSRTKRARWCNGYRTRDSRVITDLEYKAGSIKNSFHNLLLILWRKKKEKRYRYVLKLYIYMFLFDCDELLDVKRRTPPRQIDKFIISVGLFSHCPEWNYLR